MADDRHGICGPVFGRSLPKTGYLAAIHPEQLIFQLLAGGFTGKCFDGQNFLDTGHPAKDKTTVDVSVSNSRGGAGTPWFLPDTSREIKPLIWQDREPYPLESAVSSTDHSVFTTNEFRFEVRARANAGYGLWQLAYGSKQPLTAANHARGAAVPANG